MTEEIVDNIEVESQEVSPDIEKAISGGWKPQEEWQGDPDNWVDAKEFNRRGELMGKITSQNRKITELNTAMKRMHEMMVHTNEQAYQQALQELASQREQALNDGDTDQVKSIESKAKQVMDGLETSRKEVKEKYSLPETPAYFDEWLDANPWYNQDEERTAYANSLANQKISKAQSQGKEIDRQALLEDIAKKVNKVFSSNNNQASPDVLGSSKHTSVKGVPRGKGISSLRQDEQQIARTIMQTTGMTEAEYMKSYNSVKSR